MSEIVKQLRCALQGHPGFQSQEIPESQPVHVGGPPPPGRIEAVLRDGRPWTVPRCIRCGAREA